MAELKGILKISGKLGGLSFYKMNGKIIVRNPGGFDGEKIRKDEKYANVRMNASEFGRCSKFGGKLRRALRPFVKDFHDPILHGRVAKMLHDLMKLDPVSPRVSGRYSMGCYMLKAKKSLTVLYGTPVMEKDAAMIMINVRCFSTVFLNGVRKLRLRCGSSILMRDRIRWNLWTLFLRFRFRVLSFLFLRTVNLTRLMRVTLNSR